MGKYENGMSTRKLILNVSKKLFLEKGFHETSSDDICRAAHVNRSAIHYHYRDKENLRYEVLWQIFMENRAEAAKYCTDPEFQTTSAIYLSWCQVVHNPALRRFHVDYSRDYPVYARGKSLSEYYRLLYQYTLGNIWPLEKIDDLDFSAIYGHLMGQMQLVDSQPGQYTGRELFLHGMKACLLTWAVPEDKGRQFWASMLENIQKIPEDIAENI